MDIFFIFSVLYSTLLHLPPHRFHCVGGCWDRTQDSCDFGIGCPSIPVETVPFNNQWPSAPRLTDRNRIRNPDPTPFFSDFKDAKQNSYFFLITIWSILKIKILCKNFILQAFLQYSQHLYEKREESRSGRPKNLRILRIRISNTGTYWPMKSPWGCPDRSCRPRQYWDGRWGWRTQRWAAEKDTWNIYLYGTDQLEVDIEGSSVANPWHFGTGLRVPLFSSVTFKTPTNKGFHA
jgi:hypothetical protein